MQALEAAWFPGLHAGVPFWRRAWAEIVLTTVLVPLLFPIPVLVVLGIGLWYGAGFVLVAGSVLTAFGYAP